MIFTSRSTELPSTFSVARKIIEKDGFGLRGLNKGLTATIGRNGVFNMIYFGFYHSVKDHFPAYDDPNFEFMRKVTIGFTSGTIASIANIPLDVAKSRIQVRSKIRARFWVQFSLDEFTIIIIPFKLYE